MVAKSWDEDGVLTVHVLSAQELPKKGLGKQDPYLKVGFGGQELKSTVCKGGGSHPVWNEKFYFAKRGAFPGVPEIAVYDKSFPKDIKMGVSKVPFEFALPDRNEEMTVPLLNTKTDDRAGSLILALSLTPFPEASSIQLSRLPYSESADAAHYASTFGPPSKMPRSSAPAPAHGTRHGHPYPPPYGAPGAYPPPYPPTAYGAPPPAYPPPGYPPPYGYPPAQGPPNVVVVPARGNGGYSRGFGGGFGGRPGFGGGGLMPGLGMGFLGGGLLGYGLGGGFSGGDCGGCDCGD